MTGASLGYSGTYNGTSLNNVGAKGTWWSATIRNQSASYNVDINVGGNIYPQYSGDKNIGRAVRCVNQT